MRLQFKPWSSQDRLALIVRVLVYGQLLTVAYQCGLVLFVAYRNELLAKYGQYGPNGYTAKAQTVFAARQTLGEWFDLLKIAFPLAVFVCFLFGLLVLRIPRKQVTLYMVLCFLSLVLGACQQIGNLVLELLRRSGYYPDL